MQRLPLTTLLVLVGTLTMPGYPLADDIDALRWCIDEDTCRSLEKRCEAGEAQRCLDLGNLVRKSELLNSREQQALSREFYEKACQLNHQPGCVAWGKAIVRGEPAKGRGLFEAACDNGNPDGCVQLAIGLANGRFGEPTPERAFTLYEHACTLGSQDGCRLTASAIHRGMGVKQDESRAATLMQDLCDGQDHTAACIQLAGWHRDGAGIETDPEKARQYFTKACTAGHQGACREIDDNICKEAESCFNRCDANDPNACFQLGTAYIEGLPLVTAENHVEGSVFLTKACELEYGLACHALAPMYVEYDGVGPDLYPEIVEKNNATAAEFVRRACDLGVANACHQVAGAAEIDDGDLDTALDRYQLACDLGAAQSCREAARVLLQLTPENELTTRVKDRISSLEARACTLRPQQSCFD